MDELAEDSNDEKRLEKAEKAAERKAVMQKSILFLFGVHSSICCD